MKHLASKKYFVRMSSGTKLDGIRKKLFLDRYSLKNKEGKPVEEYPEQMWKRVSWSLSRAEKTKKLQDKWFREFYNAMVDFRFCPNGRFLTTAGSGAESTLGGCFVIPNPEDTRAGIIKTLEQMTEISARGGGVGFNLSSLRPRGSYLKTVNGTSSGSVSWANLYSVAAHDIIQQGGTRRGALMMMLWDWHPDIEEFISVKREQGKILGANLSVCISDNFMQALKADANWDLKFPKTNFKKYRSEWDGDIVDWEKKGYPIKIYKTLKARDLWNQICDSAWASAEPGVVFMDRYNSMNNTWYFERIIATNPCGEQGLPAWGMCNLSSINLSALVKDGELDFDEFEKLIRVGVRFLDNAVDTEVYIYDEIEKKQKSERRIGLGTIGLADALIKMKIRYGSLESLKVIEKIFKTLRDVAYEASIDLAREKGSFPEFNPKKYLQGGFIKTLPISIRKKIKKYGIRNSLLLTQAPTGKISLLAGVSSGIEPVFSFSYTQKDRLGERTMLHPLYKELIDKGGGKDIPDYFVTADQLTPEEHVAVQALIQKYTDSSISKTVNAPKTHSVDDVKRLYMLAYEKGCKGISYMREGSREGTLIRAKSAEEGNKKNGELKGSVAGVWERPMKVSGSTYKLKTPVGTAFITINHDPQEAPIEVFINVGRAGSDVQAMAEALGRLISKSLKFSSTMSVQDRAMIIIDQLKGIGGTRPIGFGVNRIASLPDAVAKALIMDMGIQEDSFIKMPYIVSADGLETKSVKQERNFITFTKNADLCPSCGNATLVHEMGCKTCYSCGYSEC